MSQGTFDVVIGGDLSGVDTGNYEDIEGPLAEKVGAFEVYKVHHHGSRYSSNDKWLAKINAQVGIISTGNGNRYGHPTQLCLERLHAHNVRTYWTETGAGTAPVPGRDVVAGNVIVEYVPGSTEFTVTNSAGTVSDSYSTDTAPTPPGQTFSWSRRSRLYHYSTCRYVQNISSHNLRQNTQAPAGKRLHDGCPK